MDTFLPISCICKIYAHIVRGLAGNLLTESGERCLQNGGSTSIQVGQGGREAKPLLNVRLINCGLKLPFSDSPGVFLLSVKTSSVNNKTAEKLSVRNTGKGGKRSNK